jgi:uncharacterized protein (DUF427 family)
MHHARVGPTAAKPRHLRRYAFVPCITPMRGGIGDTAMKATWNGAVLAESDDIVLVEGNAYFPESSLQRAYVTFSNHRTSSPKGQAHYYSLFVNGEMLQDAVWYYPEPTDTAANIRGRVAFAKGVKVE